MDRRLRTWIEVITRKDLLEEKVKVERIGDGAWVWLGKGKKGKIFRGRREITLNFGGKLPIPVWQWGKMLTKVSQDLAPPESHVFLRDARHASNIGRHRRAVLDAATAAELGLARLRDDHLDSATPALADYVAGKGRQIGGLTEFLVAVGQELPARIQQEVGEPRNDGIHESQEPDAGTAANAVAKAQEIVDLALPPTQLL